MEDKDILFKEGRDGTFILFALNSRLTNATLCRFALHCIKLCSICQALFTGLEPPFLTVFAANTGCIVSNMVVKKGDFCYQKMAIVKQPQIVEKLINTGKIAMQRSRKQRPIVSNSAIDFKNCIN